MIAYFQIHNTFTFNNIWTSAAEKVLVNKLRNEAESFCFKKIPVINGMDQGKNNCLLFRVLTYLC